MTYKYHPTAENGHPPGVWTGENDPPECRAGNHDWSAWHMGLHYSQHARTCRRCERLELRATMPEWMRKARGLQ